MYNPCLIHREESSIRISLTGLESPASTQMVLIYPDAVLGSGERERETERD